jgi:anti-sigma regulatory factor (Ser/Thr protein kinase)
MEHTATTGPGRTILADLTLRPHASEVSRSRHVVGAVLRRSGCENARDDTELIVSELVANAVEFAQNEVRLTLFRTGSRLRVEVHDDGGGEPEVAYPPPLAEAGRGLFIVQRLATSWGVAHDASGKTVWSELYC